MTLPTIAVSTFDLTLPISKKKLTCRRYLVKEDKILLMAAQDLNALDEIANATRNVINACVIKPTEFDIADYSVIDSDWLMINLRAKSVGEKVDVSITCSNKNSKDETCNTTFNVPITITDLTIKDADHASPKVIAINNDVSVKMKPTIFKASLDNSKFESKVDETISLLYNSIECVFDKTSVWTPYKDFTKEEFIDWIEMLETRVFSEMVAYVENQPYLILEKKEKCPKCGFEHDIHVHDPLSFF